MFVKSFSNYQAIYGTIAVIPTFLIWIYISWVIVILGAHITFCLSSFRLIAERAGRKDPDWNFLDVCRIITVLWQAQKEGRAISVPKLKKILIRIPIYQINEIMETLEGSRWVNRDNNSNWLLSRDMSDQTLLDVYLIVPNRMPIKGAQLSDVAQTKKLTEILEQYQVRIEDLFQLPAEEILKAD